MSEHRIRLRGGWECREVGPTASKVERIELPLHLSADVAGRLRLTRRFGRPPLEPGRQRLILEMDQVAGTRSITLNGEPIAAVSPETAQYAIELTKLAERNVLVLEIDTPSPGASPAGSGEHWGVIALVIQEAAPALAPKGPGIVGPIDIE
jgi:hypothetical protein